MARPEFKAIVVGGGPCGITAAYCLHLAGIDFAVLERRDSSFENVGASVVLSAPTLRVMYQFGILEDVLAIGCEIGAAKSFTADGKLMKSSEMFKRMKDNHGHGPVAYHRAQLIEVMYKRLPEEAKAKFHFNKKLVDIESNEDGVKATCDDGSTYEGSVIIGADGVHSRTRLIMRDMALKANPSASWDPELPYTATYNLLWACFPRPTEEMGQGYDTQDQDRSIMYVTGRDMAWVFLYKKLAEPTKGYVSYKQEDIDAVAEEFKDFHVNETLTVKELWKTKMGTGMTTLDEGIAKHWSWGRIVLVGDACHKFTPNAGAGLNNGISDIVTLCNGLREEIHADPSGNPTQNNLTKMFAAYQSSRIAGLQADASLSANLTRVQAWATPVHYFLSKYVMCSSLIEHYMVALFISKAMSTAPVLNYVPGEEPLKGAVPWTHPIPARVEKM
ncbi:FAD binding domain-containing [Fusarium albosuccineum]|uniref:FAD binding domain-containing n=1 Tax=Fusarium albosuccineum TaxID=1237068 RepID=A0A8H4KYU0_9HYPO|nr:FAD binding domain-containing [Fusarium albosuccineum]